MAVHDSGSRTAPGRQGGSTRVVLLVEQQAARARAMARVLGRHGYRCLVTRATEEAFFCLATETVHLVIIGSEAVARSGKTLLGVMQGRYGHVAKLALGPAESSVHAVKALAQGADDVASLDLSEAELLARVAALLRRNEDRAVLRKRIGDLAIDIATRRVWLADQEIQLTTKEFDLLLYFIQHADRVVTAEMLARDVWREPNRATPLQPVIYVHLSNLRRKLGRKGEINPIRTIRGTGYQLCESVFLFPRG